MIFGSKVSSQGLPRGCDVVEIAKPRKICSHLSLLRAGGDGLLQNRYPERDTFGVTAEQPFGTRANDNFL